jgi:hemolysin activation/secretion protein
MAWRRQACAGRWAAARLLARSVALSALAPALVLAQTPTPSPTPPAEPPRAAAEAGPEVQVRGFVVEGNTLLAQERLDAVLAPYMGPNRLARLREAAAAVQDLYRLEGYGGVVAFLPGQTAADGIVRIRVVEGKLSKVGVSGHRLYSADAIRAALPALKEGRTPEVRLIDAQLQLANENPARNVQVLLQPGSEPATVEAQLTVTERSATRTTLRADNTGSQSSGRWRTALGWQHANLFGTDQVLNLEAQTAPRDARNVKILSGAWRLPLPAQLSTIDAFAAWSDVKSGATATAAGDLDFQGQGTVIGLRGTRYLPRWNTLDQRISLGLESREYRNQCTIEGLPEAACGSAGASVSLQPVNLTYTAQSAGELPWGLSLGLHGNTAMGGRHGKAADFEAVRAGSTRIYKLGRVAANIGTGALPWLWEAGFTLQFSAQATRSTLVPGEQFGIGGAQSVRGYDERELNGDNGAQLSIELVTANLLDKLFGEPALLRLLLLADAGHVNNPNGDNCQENRTSCRIGSLGLGLRFAQGDFAARLDVARAYAAGARTDKGDIRAHATFTFGF